MAYLTGDLRFHLNISEEEKKKNRKYGVRGFFHLHSGVCMGSRKQPMYSSRDFQEGSLFFNCLFPNINDNLHFLP